MKTKICTKCGIEKLSSEFSKDKKTKNGLNYICKLCSNKKSQKWRDKNKKHISKYKKSYYEENKEEVLIKSHLYYINHKEEYKLYNKSDKRKQYNKHYFQQRKQNDINFRLAGNLRNRVRLAIKNNWKFGKTLELLGCSTEFLIRHLESQFVDGMTWNNYGQGKEKWNIDHIKPCASFDLSKPSEQRKCFHYTNLQPLWAIDNIKKNANF